MRARVRPNAMHVITGLLAADREGERGKIFNPMTAARARGTRTFDRRSWAEDFLWYLDQ